MDAPAFGRGGARFGAIDFDNVRQNRAWFVGLGAVFMALGMLAILLPFAASLVSAFVIGWLLVVGGVFQGVHAIQNRGWGGAGWALAGAVLEVIAGALIIAFPIAGKLTITLVLAGYFAAQGIVKIVRAMQHRAMRGFGWLLFDGILELVLAVLIVVGWPGTGIWALGLLVGIDLLFGGSSMLLIGLSARAPREVRT